MIRLLALLAGMLLAFPAGATVFTFYETSCSPAGFPGRCLDSPSLPFALFNLTISDASGSATYSGWVDTPVVSDPTFSFTETNPGDPGGIYIQPPRIDLFHPYSFAWTAEGEELTSFSGFAGGTNTRVSLGLTGGVIGSDGSLGSCANGSCQIAGFWVDPVAVPEPGTLLLAGALLGFLALLNRIPHKIANVV